MNARTETDRWRAVSLRGVLIYWGPLFVWLLALFAYSSNAAAATETGRILRPLVRFLFGESSEQVLALLNVIVRKTAHVVTYAALALLAFRAVRFGRRERWRLSWALQALGLTFVYAALDEFLQSYHAGRTGTVADVLLDLLGGALALTALGILRRGR